MKIPHSIRDLYAQQNDLNKTLKEKVDQRLLSLKEPRWHYESRLKQLESFALKMESGRVSDPEHLEDFFACALVVENAQTIGRAEALILDNFKLTTRRPRKDDFTHKGSNSFPFDDLRLYVKWSDDPEQKATGLDGVLFEVQLKTFLQHAWDIATHDLVYKSDTVSWAKERIAYQIKAMLEHAEVSILEVEKMAESVALNKKNRYVSELLDTIAIIKKFWPEDLLPRDMVRLAKNILSVLQSVDLSLRELDQILKHETDIGKGSNNIESLALLHCSPVPS